MRLGVISDVHGNLPALEAVLDGMPTVDALVCAGDVVGYNPWPAECVDTVRERGIPSVQGNHDRAVASGRAPGFNGMAQAGVDYAREQLDADALDWLDALPTERHVANGRVKVVHGHPDDPDHYTYPREFAPDLLDGEELLIMGHTHVQHHAVFDEGIVLNPGSVGQPRDRDPDAAYAVVDLDDRTVDERRVSYDIDAVVDAVADTDLPPEIGERLRDGR
ncbi:MULTISPECIES: metallophosphoesterase family protein [Halolamina]|uniref:Phosphoesterase n=1 Tax=Halolamina pelagica TaxID=699431 RepID=A0A1I5RYI7_9EURY|nr:MULTISPECIES: metallophosphoesterase family protein [Halolamina]NHX35389.1 metallophosphoesterase family protein [Halolamina sp. R1-12]SFP63056.1 phosphoesterase, MJ0936 family [Halolamina pelagica]